MTGNEFQALLNSSAETPKAIAALVELGERGAVKRRPVRELTVRRKDFGREVQLRVRLRQPIENDGDANNPHARIHVGGPATEMRVHVVTGRAAVHEEFSHLYLIGAAHGRLRRNEPEIVLAFLVLPLARGCGGLVRHREHDRLVGRFVLDGGRFLDDLERFLDRLFICRDFGLRLGRLGVYDRLLFNGRLRFFFLAAGGYESQQSEKGD